MATAAATGPKPIGQAIYIAIIAALVGALAGGYPAYIGIGPLKPDRVEVSMMIKKEAPLAVSYQFESLTMKLSDIHSKQIELAVKQELILENLKSILR